MQQFGLQTKGVFKQRNKIADPSKLSVDDAFNIEQFRTQTDRTMFNATTQAGMSQSSFRTMQNASHRYSKIDNKFGTQQKQHARQQTLFQYQQYQPTPVKNGLFRLESIQNLDQQHLNTEVKEEAKELPDYEKGSLTLSYRNEVTLPKVEKKKRVNRSTFVVKPAAEDAPSKRSSIFAETPKKGMTQPPKVFLTSVPATPIRSIPPEHQPDASEGLPKRRSTLASLPPLPNISRMPPLSPVKSPKKGPVHFATAVHSIDDGVFDVQRDLRTMERDEAQLRSDLGQMHFNITLKNRATTDLVMDSLMDLRKELHRFVRDDEAKAKFVGAQIKSVQAGQQQLKQEVLKLDQRGAACEAEIGTDADIWYPTWYSPPDKGASPARSVKKEKLKRKHGSKGNDEQNATSN